MPVLIQSTNVQSVKFVTIILTALLILVAGHPTLAQTKTATITGVVIDEEDEPVSGVSVVILGRQSGTTTTDSGAFRLEVPAGRAFALTFSHTAFHELQKSFMLSSGEEEHQIFRLYRTDKILETVVVRDERFRKETGLVRMNPTAATVLPSATGGVEGLIKVLVGSNNELTSQYSVRGGNYDENLVYLNGFEVYRPYLTRSGQQEGLSLINPELVKNISFYNGGFQARHGDKISSVLEIEYKQPRRFAGSAYISLLEQGFHLEGSSAKNNLSWLAGVRTKTNRNLLGRQETKGNYVPSASDAQMLLTWKISEKFSLEALGIVSVSDFELVPESAQKTQTIITPQFSANMGLDIFFEGREKDRYRSNLAGLTLRHSPRKHLNLQWLASRYDDRENEHFDIIGAYIFGERGFDKSKPDFGQITNPLGAGVFQNYARNELRLQLYNISHKGSLQQGNHFMQWGAGWGHYIIRDRLDEWEMLDSAGYSLPHTPGNLVLKNVLQSSAALNTSRFDGFIQDNIRLGSRDHDVFLQGGVRFNYNTLNKEFLVSPRSQISYKPNWKRDIVFKASAGFYAQPPFYRELRRPDGTLNKDIKSQKSWQFVAAIDYNTRFGERPLRITSEAYYKKLWDVISYNLDNVRLTYSGENDAHAYAAGIETRIYTELVKDAESWLSVNVSRTMENLTDDYFFLYTNAAGEVIGSQTEDRIVADSIRSEIGWIRRPSDRLITVGLFLQDYLSTNKNFKVHLNLIYGSNMTYSIPDNPRFRNALILDPYFRVDVGFSALLLSQKQQRRSHAPFRAFDNIWASLEIFNLIDRSNVISYHLIKDFANNTFSIPNRLTPRLVNFKLLARF